MVRVYVQASRDGVTGHIFEAFGERLGACLACDEPANTAKPCLREGEDRTRRLHANLVRARRERGRVL
jgi:hypothetical protein